MKFIFVIAYFCQKGGWNSENIHTLSGLCSCTFCEIIHVLFELWGCNL